MAPQGRTDSGGRRREGLSGFASLLLAIALVLRNLSEGRGRKR
jgi:hypothetical protein